MDLRGMMQVECSMESVLLYGRYIKLSREVSQTPWLIGTKKLVRLSIVNFSYREICRMRSLRTFCRSLDQVLYTCTQL